MTYKKLVLILLIAAIFVLSGCLAADVSRFGTSPASSSQAEEETLSRQQSDIQLDEFYRKQKIDRSNQAIYDNDDTRRQINEINKAAVTPAPTPMTVVPSVIPDPAHAADISSVTPCPEAAVTSTTAKPTATPAPTTAKPTATPAPVPTTAKPTETPAPTTAKPTATPAPTTAKPTATPAPVPATAKPTKAPTADETVDWSNQSIEQWIAEIFRLTNKERTAAGLSTLAWPDAELSQAAMIRAEETADLFSHDRPDGQSCFTVLDECGVIRSTAGENLLYSTQGAISPQGMVDAWMASEGHRLNILNPKFKSIGIGFFQLSGYDYATQLFIG